jgi:Tfp pilus assembly protein PilO
MTLFMNKRLIRKYRAYLLPVVVLLLIIWLSLQIVKPKIESIVRLDNEMKLSRMKLEVLLKKANALSVLDPIQLKDMFDTLNTAIPSDKDIPGFMLGIGRAAQEASVSVGLVEVSPGSVSTSSADKIDSKKSITPVTAKVTVRGTFANIISFVSKITNGRRLLKIEGINLSGAGAQRVNEQLSMVFSILVYYQPLPESLGEISLPIVNITDSEEKDFLMLRNFPYYSFIGSQDINTSSSSVQSGTVPVGKADLFNR